MNDQLHFFKRFGQWWCVEKPYNPKDIEAYHERWPAYGGRTMELALRSYQRHQEYQRLADEKWEEIFPSR